MTDDQACHNDRADERSIHLNSSTEKSLGTGGQKRPVYI